MSVSLTRIQGIVTTTETIGAKVPADLTKAIARAAKIREAVYSIRSGRQDLAAATLTAIDAGRDPAADPEVQAILTRRALTDGVEVLVANMVDADVVTALQGNVDALIESWQAPFDKAAQEIATAAASLGNIDLDNAADVLHKGGNAAEQWGIATRANRTIREITDAWTTLAHQTGFAPLNRHHIVMRMAEPTLEQWEDQQLQERNISAWEANGLGLKLSLANRETLPQRINSIATQRAARAQAGIDRETGKGAHDWTSKY